LQTDLKNGSFFNFQFSIFNFQFSIHKYYLHIIFYQVFRVFSLCFARLNALTKKQTRFKLHNGVSSALFLFDLCRCINSHRRVT